MTWSWSFHLSEGDVDAVSPAPDTFPAQSDAETWIGEEWPALIEAGVAAVTLLEDGREVYGPMSLLPPP